MGYPFVFNQTEKKDVEYVLYFYLKVNMSFKIGIPLIYLVFPQKLSFHFSKTIQIWQKGKTRREWAGLAEKIYIMQELTYSWQQLHTSTSYSAVLVILNTVAQRSEQAKCLKSSKQYYMFTKWCSVQPIFLWWWNVWSGTI